MDCNKCIEKISPYIDNELSKIEREEFEEHLKECGECDKAYNETLEMIKSVKFIKDEPLPSDYKYTLRNKLEKESNFKGNKGNKRKWIGLGIAAVVIFIVFIMPGMFYMKNNNSDMDSALEESTDMTNSENNMRMDDSIGDSANDIESEERGQYTEEAEESTENILENKNKKIIKNAHIRMDIIEFNRTLEEISEYIKSQGGFIQNSNIRTVNRDREEHKEGYVTIKVPEEHLDKTIEFISGKGKTNNTSTNSDDVTKEYIDIEARLNNLNIQEARLGELMDEAERIEDILNIENELRRIRTEIEQYQSRMDNLEYLVSYSTINLELIEVNSIDDKIQASDNNIFLESKKGFISTINSMIKVFERSIIFIISYLPILILLGVVILIILLRKRNNNSEK